MRFTYPYQVAILILLYHCVLHAAVKMDLSWLDVWWLGQLLLVASCFILDALHAKDLSPPDSPIRFYQFHKKYAFVLQVFLLKYSIKE